MISCGTRSCSVLALSTPSAISAADTLHSRFLDRKNGWTVGAVGVILQKGEVIMKQSFSVSIVEENGICVAQCLEVDVASQGESREEALKNLQEALTLYFEDPQPSFVPEIKKIEVEVSVA